MRSKTLKLLDLAAQTIFDKKGFNILALNVTGLSTVTDYFLIAEGNVDRHVISLSKDVQEALRKRGEKPLFIDGEATGDWLVMDYGDFVVHLFQPEYRQKYELEDLWKKASVVDLNIRVEHE